MSLFTRRHFRRIAEIAAKMDLTSPQFDILCCNLTQTNALFDESRFRTYYRDKKT